MVCAGVQPNIFESGEFPKDQRSLASWIKNFSMVWGAAIAQWILSRFPSCSPGFESHAHHLCFYQFEFVLQHFEKMKIN